MLFRVMGASSCKPPCGCKEVAQTIIHCPSPANVAILEHAQFFGTGPRVRNDDPQAEWPLLGGRPPVQEPKNGSPVKNACGSDQDGAGALTAGLAPLAAATSTGPSRSLTQAEVSVAMAALVKQSSPDRGCGEAAFADAKQGLQEGEALFKVPPVASPSSKPVLLDGGATYRGSWLGTKKHGQGTLQLPEGSRYVGQFEYDLKSGHGSYSYPSGSTYSGQWLEDLQHGDGNENWADGSAFEGQFVSGEKHGWGRFIWGAGCMYEGEFEHNDMHGEGTYSWSDSRMYSGKWQHNFMGPAGTMQWPDGRVYEGEFRNGKKHGEGTHFWPDGRAYKGQWEEGKQHGEGIARTARGVECRGLWKDGKFSRWFTEGNGKTGAASSAAGVTDGASNAGITSAADAGAGGARGEARVTSVGGVGVDNAAKAGGTRVGDIREADGTVDVADAVEATGADAPVDAIGAVAIVGAADAPDAAAGNPRGEAGVTDAAEVTEADPRGEDRAVESIQRFSRRRGRLEALSEADAVGISDASLSGDGTVDNVGIRVSGSFPCRDCCQKFEFESARDLHWKFFHDPNRHQED